ncbi:unnamed protein product [Prunus armeniaca]
MLRTPMWCRPKALRSLSQLRVVPLAEEVKVGGLCRFPMWDFVQVATVVTRVMEIRGRRRVCLGASCFEARYAQLLMV